MRTLSELNSTNNELGMRQLRLATGSRINRAEDDSAGYTIAKKLQARTRGQAQALSNISDAKSMLTVGEGSLNSVMDILQTMKEKSIQAANDTMGTDERTAIETQMDALYSEIGDIIGNTDFNGQNLFDGSTKSFQVDAGANDAFTFQLASYSDAGDVVAGVSSSGQAATVSTPVATAGGQYDAWTGVNGGITIEDNNYTGTTSGSLYFKKDGTDLLVSTEDSAAGFASPLQTVDLTGYAAGGALSVQGMTISFDDAFADLADNEGFKIDVQAAVAAGADTYVGALSTAADAQTAIGNIDAAIANVASELSQLGDAQGRLTLKQDNVESSMTNYEAARSRIEDADFAKEQMEIVKLQILQQTSTAMLAQANTAPQSVLSLF
jgi:flagellin